MGIGFVVVLGLVFAYLFVTASIASIFVYLSDEDEDFALIAWISGMIVFVTVTIYLMTKLGMWG